MMQFDSQEDCGTMNVGNNPPVDRLFMVDALEAAAAAAVVDTYNSH